MKEHFSDCDCGYSRIDPCLGEIPIEPDDPIFCFFCGRQMSGSMWYSITLSNGKTYVSNVNITVEDILVLNSLLQLNMTYNEINILVTLANRNPQFFSLEGNDLHEHNHIHEKECNHDYHFHKSIGYTCDMNKVCCNNTVAIIQKEEEFYEKMKRN